jgi:hypothetical protein
VKQNLYTCGHCGREQRTAEIERADAPLGWAVVTFRREYAEAERDRLLAHQTLTTHTCSDCCVEVLAFLEKATPPTKEVDSAFDDGGAA